MELTYFVQLYTIKFHGKPPSIKPLINSINAKTKEKIIIDEKFLSNLNFATIKVIKP
tara:strand:+ start:2097 stop:2267 length:171 start_codon:yes stop_codon:yes gene_type:complete